VANSWQKRIYALFGYLHSHSRVWYVVRVLFHAYVLMQKVCRNPVYHPLAHPAANVRRHMRGARLRQDSSTAWIQAIPFTRIHAYSPI